MANNKDLIIDTTVEVGGTIKESLGNDPTISYETENYNVRNLPLYRDAPVRIDLSPGLGTDITKFEFGNDGNILYYLEEGNNVIYQYNLTNGPYDISAASYANTSGYDVGTTAKHFFFKPDGLTMYVINSFSTTGHIHTLTTPWDLDTASGPSSWNLPNTSFCTKASPDGTKLYMTVNSGTLPGIRQYSTSTPWNFNSTFLTQDIIPSKFMLPAGGTSGALGSIGQDIPNWQIFRFNSDGTKFIVTVQQSHYRGKIFEVWDVETPYDLRTAKYAYTGKLYTETRRGLYGDQTTIGDFDFNSDGSSLYTLTISGVNDNTIQEYPCSTNTAYTTFDLSTGNYFDYILNDDVNIKFDNAAETQTFKIEIDTYNVGAFDFNTISEAGETRIANNQFFGAGPYSLYVSPDGKFVTTAGYLEYTMNTWEMTTPHDLSTAELMPAYSNVAITDVNTGNLGIDSLWYSPDGHILYMYDRSVSNDRIYQFNLSKSFRASAEDLANYAAIKIMPSAELGTGFALSSNGRYAFIANPNQDDIRRYTLDTPWQIDTLDSFSVIDSIESTGTITVSDLWVSEDGRHFVTGNQTGSDFVSFYTPVPWDVRQLKRTSSISLPIQALGIAMSPDGTKIYTGSNASIRSYDVGTRSAPTITWPENINWRGSPPSAPIARRNNIVSKSIYTFTTKDGGQTYTGYAAAENTNFAVTYREA
jgi:6-phosphogluconolactonase (cycloisomerase 2 family)